MRDTAPMTEVARICTPGMSPFERFQKGDKVAHVLNGDGVVAWNLGGVICVNYTKGKGFLAKYDSAFFAKYPRYLYHRNIEPIPDVACGPQYATNAEIEDKVRDQLANDSNCYD